MDSFFSYADQDIQISYRQDSVPLPANFRMHTHETYELYYFVGGRGVYRVEGTPYPLESGDILLMRPAEAHYVDIRDTAPYTRLTVNFRPELFEHIDPAGQLLLPFNRRALGTFNRYRAENFTGSAYRTLLDNLTADCPDRRLQTVTNLAALLNEIAAAYTTMNEAAASPSLDCRIISFINRHLAEELSLNGISRRFFISESQLCRIFKKATGSTVWEYITVKRLVSARRLILSGMHPTKAYLQCGFKDYSVFYRAYRKQYGVPPSASAAPAGQPYQ